MKAALYEDFGAPLKITSVPDPVPGNNDAVIKIMASGICRSDWHGWLGRDPDIKYLPHIPGHELSGIVEAVGKNVTRWKKGDRITAPFVCGCGNCAECNSGNHHICDNQSQPGFTHWGSFAEYTKIKNADINLVRLPEEIDFITVASLGCRFSTSFRAITAQGKLMQGQWLAVHGCGGIGLSAIMIAHAIGVNIVAIDINENVLDLAKSLGATIVINALNVVKVAEAIKEITGGGAHVSIDALGSKQTCINSINCLRKRGRHIQVGLLVGDDYYTSLPMDLVISRELEIVGSHGMQANAYGKLLELISSGKLQPQKIIGKTIPIEKAPTELESMGNFGAIGITIINQF